MGINALFFDRSIAGKSYLNMCGNNVQTELLISMPWHWILSPNQDGTCLILIGTRWFIEWTFLNAVAVKALLTGQQTSRLVAHGPILSGVLWNRVNATKITDVQELKEVIDDFASFCQGQGIQEHKGYWLCSPYGCHAVHCQVGQANDKTLYNNSPAFICL